MKTIRQLQEGFHNTSGSGMDANKKLVEDRVKLFTKSEFIVNDDMSVTFKDDYRIVFRNSTEKELGFTIKEINSEMLTIECEKLTSLVGLPQYIKIIELEDCGNISNLNGISETTSLDITSCHKLKSLKGIKNCDKLDVYACRNLNSLDIDSIILDIKVTGCKKLTNINISPTSIQKADRILISKR